jgi:hypothetical protein
MTWVIVWLLKFKMFDYTCLHLKLVLDTYCFVGIGCGGAAMVLLVAVYFSRKSNCTSPVTLLGYAAYILCK